MCLLRSLCGGVYHIGVGSDVVCSTGLGSARASMCGTDNRTTHAFFVSVYHVFESLTYSENTEQKSI